MFQRPPMGGGAPQGGGSFSDVLTLARNIAQAINDAALTYLSVQGKVNQPLISAATLVKAGQGRVCSISVTTAGATTGAVYDTNLATSTVNLIYVIPMAIGLNVVNLPVGIGIVVVPGTNQVLTVSYS